MQPADRPAALSPADIATTADEIATRQLLAGFDRVEAFVEPDPDSMDKDSASAAWSAFERELTDSDTPLARFVLGHLCSSFEMKLVLLALAVAADPELGYAVGRYAGHGRPELTVRTALATLCEPEHRLQGRRSFLPTSGLRRRGALRLRSPTTGASGNLLDQVVELSDAVTRYLLGEPSVAGLREGVTAFETPQLGLLSVVAPQRALDSLRRLVDQHPRFGPAARAWGIGGEDGGPDRLLVLVSGASGTGKTLAARALAGHARRPLLTVHAEAAAAGDAVAELREALLEAELRGALLAVEGCEAVLGRDAADCDTVLRLLQRFAGVCILTTARPEALAPEVRSHTTFHLSLPRPDAEARRALWELHLGPGVPIAGAIDLGSLATRYDFTGADIRNALMVATHEALARTPRRGAPAVTPEILEAACESQLSHDASHLVTCEEGRHTLADIVLPAAASAKVVELIAAARNQGVVLGEWGFGRALSKGKGLIALFDGPPGTGKTFCAEVIAAELGRPLHSVDLAQVVSKWAGETEKHIRAVFRSARASRAVLLFDEADSLFSSRVAETRTSADRQSNMEVNLLLQEIERFPGVCILTTNSFGTLDSALVRRLQIRATFERPGAVERDRIWRVLCPREAPLAPDVDFAALAERFDLSGAEIKNALLRAAYRACDAGATIDQATLVVACVDEYASAGKVTRHLDVAA